MLSTNNCHLLAALFVEQLESTLLEERTLHRFLFIKEMDNFYKYNRVILIYHAEAKCGNSLRTYTRPKIDAQISRTSSEQHTSNPHLPPPGVDDFYRIMDDPPSSEISLEFQK
jgi:hypothetical protein